MECFDAADLNRFKAKGLDAAQIRFIGSIASKSRADVLRMTTRAGSGHPGGSLSSVDIFLMLWLCANCLAGDHIVVSHGHTSAGIYAVLGNLGYFDVEEAVVGFRKAGSIFEGHPSTQVPGVEWCSGSLGQGLSVGCGFALAQKMRGESGHVFVVMGDGEQQKGQLAEAREFAVKFGLSNLTAVIDCNGLQASGAVQNIMPADMAGKYSAAGWNVVMADGNDYEQLYAALRGCYIETDKPTVIVAHTVMGRGVREIEGDFRYHGKTLNQQQLHLVLAELGQSCDVWQPMCSIPVKLPPADRSACEIKLSAPELYPAGSPVDCRTAFGDAVCSIAKANAENDKFKMAVLDCDLTESVKLQRFQKEYPQYYVQCGIQEHNAVTVAGALSKMGVLTFFADFGVFGADETYAQHRMNDINNTSVKLVCTHCGLDVGEDGKTHQCIDPVSLFGNLYGFRVLIPADANQTAHMVRYMAQTDGNMALLMGRSKLPVLADEFGDPLFGRAYRFEYGRSDWLRWGGDCTIVTCGTMAARAVGAAERLKKLGIAAGVLNLSCPACLDTDALLEAARTGTVITYEDHNGRTGIGSLVGAWLAEQGGGVRFRRLGIEAYGSSAPPEALYRAQGLDEDCLVRTVMDSMDISSDTVYLKGERV